MEPDFGALQSLRVAIRECESAQVIETILERPGIFGQWLLSILCFALREYEEHDSVDSKVLCLLIKHDPQVSRMQQFEGDTTCLLHKACCYNAPAEVIDLLIRLNPDALRVPIPNEGEDEGESFRMGEWGMFPLHLICCREDVSLETIKLILHHYPGAAKDGDKEGKLPLHIALSGAPEEHIMTLIDHYPEAVRKETTNGLLPLYFSFCTSKFTQKLVELYPESVSKADRFGDLPLHHVCRFPFVPLEVVKFLYERYPEAIRIKGSCERLPLHTADVNNASKETVEFLIDMYPDAVRVVDEYGGLPLHCACSYGGAREIVQLLIDRYSGEAIYHNGLAVSNIVGRIPLHCAANNQTALDLFPLLLERYPRGVRVADNDGMLPLHLVCSLNLTHGLEIVRLLLETHLFAMVQTCDTGETPLQIAFREYWRRPLETRQFLLERQDEAVRLLHEAFEPTIEQRRLSDLVVAEIWSFVLPRLWRPTEDEMNA